MDLNHLLTKERVILMHPPKNGLKNSSIYDIFTIEIKNVIIVIDIPWQAKTTSTHKNG